jgi:hypothetical protein
MLASADYGGKVVLCVTGTKVKRKEVHEAKHDTHTRTPRILL